MTNTVVQDVIGFLLDAMGNTGCTIVEKGENEFVVELPEGVVNPWTKKTACLHVIYDEKSHMLVGVYTISEKPTQFAWPDSQWQKFADTTGQLVIIVTKKVLEKLV